MTEVATQPAPPTTPAEASARLDQLRADPKWTDALLNGAAEQKAEFKSLHALAAQGDAVDLAVAGELQPGIIQTSEHMQNMGAAGMLRGIGLDDAVIKQALTGKPVSKSEFDTVIRWKSAAMADHDFTKRLMAGDGEPRRQLTAANIVLSNGYQESK
jgi:hypothetical protein